MEFSIKKKGRLAVRSAFFGLKKGLFALVLGFWAIAAFGQNGEKAKNGPRSEAPQLISFDGSDAQVRPEDFRSKLDLREGDELRVERTETDDLGFVHVQHRQFYKGVLVEGGVVSTHSKDGFLRTMSGKFWNIENGLSPKPKRTEAEAFEKALAHVGAKKYRWEKGQSLSGEAFEKPKGQLVVLPFSTKNAASEPRLAYKFDVYASVPLSRSYVFIDAMTGKFLDSHQRMHNGAVRNVPEKTAFELEKTLENAPLKEMANVAATGNAIFQGAVNFAADQTGPNAFRLRQTTMGMGVETYDLHGDDNFGAATDVTSATSNFTGDPTAVQAHFGAERTYQYYLTKFGRNSYNNAGAKLISYVHFDETVGNTGTCNAYWTGSEMLYGDGDIPNGCALPLVALDVCGHELTHAVTEATANLVYQDESGALNESFSDIFGEAVERYVKGTNDWLLSADIGLVFRSFIDPNLYGQPDTYLGDFWYSGPDDFGGVHTNSGVQNKWFYILVNGESGTNDNGDAYNVAGIGFSDAERIAYRALTNYLNMNSQYIDARNATLRAADDLFGGNSAQLAATDAAWLAVGVPNACLKVNSSISNALGVSGNRLFRDAVVSTCGNKGFPGNNSPAGVRYDAKYYRNDSGGPLCYSIDFHTKSCGASIHSMVYQTAQPWSGIVNSTGFLGDVGSSVPFIYKVTVPNGAVFAVVTHMNNAGVTCSDYGFGISPCPTVMEPPTAVCQAISRNLDAAGQHTITPTDVNDGSFDPDGGEVTLVSVVPNTFNCINLGPNQVTLTVQDNEGQQSVCQTTVTIQDMISPTVTCQSATIMVGVTENGIPISASAFLLTATDNCSVVSSSVSPNTFTCAQIGMTVPVTVSANDQSGNVGTCPASVMVEAPPSVFSVADKSLAEGSPSGATNFPFSVSRVNTKCGASVAFSTSDGTALAEDYTSTGGVLNFSAGVSNLLANVLVKKDSKVELDETFNINLSAPVNATIGDGLGIGKIENDDAASILISNVSTSEGNIGLKNFTFTATILKPADVPISFDFSTSDGTATLADNDYVSVPTATATIPTGLLSKTFSIQSKGDTKPEGNETVNVNFSNVQASGRAASLAQASRTATLTNDDGSLMVAPAGILLKKGEAEADERAVEKSLEPSAEMQLFPNPTGGFLNVILPANGGDWLLTVFDIFGKAVFVQKANLAGDELFQIDATKMASGIYFLKAENLAAAEKAQTIRWVKTDF